MAGRNTMLPWYANPGGSSGSPWRFSSSELTMLLFAVERIDTWVLWVSIGIGVMCVAGLVFWQLAIHAARKLGPPRKAVRQSPEPERVEADAEKLERTCAGLVQ